MEYNELYQTLTCEQLDDDHFRARCRNFGHGHVFGGQIMAQAMSAAKATVEANRNVHTIHASFLRAGDGSIPMQYRVERTRDGARYSSRRVIATQNDKEIIHLSASFRIEQTGSDCSPKRDLPAAGLRLAEGEFEKHNRLWHGNMLELRILVGEDSAPPNTMQTWIRPTEKLPDLQSVQDALLAYYSDIGILPSSILPYEDIDRVSAKDIITSYGMSSLNHAMWFHRPFKADEWLFYECVPEYSGSDRGLAHGRFYSRDGLLVANAVQEGMLSPPNK